MHIPTIRRRPRRSIKNILSRQEERAKAFTKKRMHAPDYMHGAFLLGSLYTNLPASVVDGLCFVVPIEGRGGDVVGYVAAKMDDHFLSMESATIYDVEDVACWVSAQVEQARMVVFADVCGVGAPSPSVMRAHLSLQSIPSFIPINLSRLQLEVLEQRVLSVEREFQAKSAHANLEQCMEQAFVDMLSLVGLCAQWMSVDASQELTIDQG